MGYEKVVALYDTPAHAEAATRSLVAAGYSSGDISRTSKATLENSELHREPGLWNRLFGGDILHHEATIFSRTVDAGGELVTVRVPEDEVPRVMGILHANDPVDVKDRAVYHGLVSEAAAAKVVAAAPAVKAAAAAVSNVAATALPSVAAATRTAVDRDEVIRLAEEQLNVGKRLVEEGTTRIRRFVTERPVQANVTLHEEHAEVLRRVVADPLAIKDIDWSDRTIEVVETAEQAVVSKSARIAEEVVVRKTGSDRVETVSDTVRRQQVEVERTPAGPAKKS